jgi:hypothetical protein
VIATITTTSGISTSNGTIVTVVGYCTGRLRHFFRSTRSVLLFLHRLLQQQQTVYELLASFFDVIVRVSINCTHIHFKFISKTDILRLYQSYVELYRKRFMNQIPARECYGKQQKPAHFG